MKVRITSIYERQVYDETEERNFRNAIDGYLREHRSEVAFGFDSEWIATQLGIQPPQCRLELMAHLVVPPTSGVKPQQQFEFLGEIPLRILPAGAQIGSEFTVYFERV